MKAQECILIVNTRCGYCFTPIVCKSIREAIRKGRNDYGGFAFRVTVKGRGVVYSGYCNND